MKYAYVLLVSTLFGPDVKDLGSEDFRVRESAEKRLTAWADLVWPALDRKFADAEVNRRARRVVAAVMPRSCPPVGVLGGHTLPEWSNDYGVRRVGPRPRHTPDDFWVLYALRPDPKSWLAPVIRHYGERARTQDDWPDWHMDGDGRRATEFMIDDLRKLGVPAPMLRSLVEYMAAREAGLINYRHFPAGSPRR